LKQISLFAGIEGFGLAGTWLGWQLVASVEMDRFCQQVIANNFPQTKIYGNIKETDFKPYNGAIDIITGGFPCQSFSLAGKGAMDLSLWKEMFRSITEVQPTWVVAENVYGLVSRKKGVALEQVCADLEGEGFTVFPPVILPACAVGAPHRRDRVWIVAYSNRKVSNQPRQEFTERKEHGQKREDLRNRFKPNGKIQHAANTMHNGLQRSLHAGKNNEKGREIKNGHFKEYLPTHRDKIQFDNFPTQSPICNGNDGLPHGLDNIKFSTWKNETIKAGGNAIVPQVFYQIGLTINELHQHLTNPHQ
jgi:DNA (cytosine-5)-methyltransferase 1